MRHTHDLAFTQTEVRKHFVSWDRGEAEREWACLSLLSRFAPGCAPRPLRRESHGDSPVIVMERLPGQPLGEAPLSPAQTAALGRVLRSVYDVPVERARAEGLAERVLGPTSLPSSLMEWLGAKPDLVECQDPALVLDAYWAARAWLTVPAHVPAPRLTCVGIADLNPANVLWDGTACRLVDFEDGGVSDPPFELADHVEHIAARLHDVYSPAALAEAVGLTDDERTRMDTYRRMWAIFWLVMLLPDNGGFARNPAGTTENQAHHVLRLLG